uniref:Secreted protein n=1 Tax=Mesocestoides corti TaxID=53468 RepID=A0A5K3G5U7_MESCO
MKATWMSGLMTITIGNTSGMLSPHSFLPHLSVFLQGLNERARKSSSPLRQTQTLVSGALDCLAVLELSVSPWRIASRRREPVLNL